MTGECKDTMEYLCGYVQTVESFRDRTISSNDTRRMMVEIRPRLGRGTENEQNYAHGKYDALSALNSFLDR